MMARAEDIHEPSLFGFTLVGYAQVADKRPAFGSLLPHRLDLCSGQPGAILAPATGRHQVARRGTRDVLQFVTLRSFTM